MESLKEILYIICCACVLSGVYTILIPEGKTGSSVRICLTLTLFLAILSPLSGIQNTDAAFQPANSTVNDFYASQAFEDTLNESLRAATEAALQKNIAEEIQVSKLYSSKDKKGNIYIVKVFLLYQGSQTGIPDRVSRYLGGNVEAVLVEE